MVAGEAATAQAQELADAALSYLPPTASPWIALIEALSTLTPKMNGGGFEVQLWCQLALIACSTMVLLSGLVIKMYQGQLWLYRIRKGYIVPHYSTAYCFFIIVMQALMLGYIYRNIQRAQGQNPTDLSLWLSLTWLPGVLGFSHAGWSLAVSHAIHVLSTQNRLTSPFLRSGFLNGLGILGPICVCVSIVTLTCLAQQKYHETLSTAVTLTGFVGKGALTYTGTFSMTTLSQVVDLTADVIQATDDYIYCFKSVFLAYAIYFALATSSLILVAGVHLRTLHQSSVDKAFEAQYKSLVVITLAFVTMGAATLSTLIFESAMSRSIITLEGYAEAGALVAGYIYIIFGLPLAFFLLSRSFRNDPRMAAPRRLKTASEAGKSSFGQVSFVIPTNKPHPSHHVSYPMSVASTTAKAPHGAAALSVNDYGSRAPSRTNSRGTPPVNFVYPPTSAFVQAHDSTTVDFAQRQQRQIIEESQPMHWTPKHGWFRSSK